MLDDEPNISTSDDSQGAPKRRRAVSRAAGPPKVPAAAPVDAEATKPKRTRKVAASAPTAPAPELNTEDAGQTKPTAARVTRARKVAAVPAGPAADISPKAAATARAIPVPLFQAPEPVAARPKAVKAVKTAMPAKTAKPAPAEAVADVDADFEGAEPADDDDSEAAAATRRRRRRGGRGRRRRPEGAAGGSETDDQDDAEVAETETAAGATSEAEDEDEGDGTGSRRRRRRRRPGEGSEDGAAPTPRVREPRRDDAPAGVRGSTRLEAKKQRRREGREAGRRRAPILTEAEFLARRESVDRVMVVRQDGDRTQIAVLEDGVLVEHYVNRSGSTSMAGNVYLGRVQNVLPSMEAAFVDIGRGRNAVLYAGEVNWDAAGMEGQPRRIELALKSGDPVLVQVTKDPVGHKGARLTSQISLPGRYLVYVPEGSMTGISRKLPDTERNRLKSILRDLVSEDAGVIVRTAAEGASEEELTSDVTRLATQWEDIKTKSATADAPALLHGEPDVAIRVVRDIFNEDFAKLIVSGATVWDTISEYVEGVAPDLAQRLEKWVEPKDMFTSFRIDEQLAKALDRKVWLPSGGSLVIDRTEAMTVVDVNTGKFTGQGGNLEETVTRNNLEAAEEIVRQLRLRDIGGIIVIDFIDMVLESNRDLVLRRLTECLGRDRTKHQVAEVTSLGLVQMTRKRIGQSLLDVFSEPCEHCNGRGLHILTQPNAAIAIADEPSEAKGRRRRTAPAAPVQVKTGLDPVDAIRAAAHSLSDEAATGEAATGEAANGEAANGEAGQAEPAARETATSDSTAGDAGERAAKSRRGRGRKAAAAGSEPRDGGVSETSPESPKTEVSSTGPAKVVAEPVQATAQPTAPVVRRPRRATTSGPITAGVLAPAAPDSA